ncbi:MAG TPA: hypothetical protein VGW36_03300 [Pyrinomonadaceae bacterium]|nr:hypothetical protein [Pyrinomonadaceae bacterium]
MSKAIIGDQLWAEMTDAEKLQAVGKGHATLKQMSEGLLDGPEELRRACEERLAHTDPSFDNLPVTTETKVVKLSGRKKHSPKRRSVKAGQRQMAHAVKQRFGLPKDFVPRLQRMGRSVLLELNVYRLPTGQEFIPAHPSGTLGTRQHLYALLTDDQFLKGKRGSVYVRSDGRIFDYSVVSPNPMGDIFDTGYTIYDLERTGRYVTIPRIKRKRKSAPSVQPARHRGAVAGGSR